MPLFMETAEYINIVWDGVAVKHFIRFSRFSFFR